MSCAIWVAHELLSADSLNLNNDLYKSSLWGSQTWHKLMCEMTCKMLQMINDVGAGDLYTLWGGAWDLHDPNRLCTAGGNGVQVRHACYHSLTHSLTRSMRVGQAQKAQPSKYSSMQLSPTGLVHAVTRHLRKTLK